MKLLLTLAWRYLTGRRLRTALTILAITFGVLLIFGMNTILPAFSEAFQANAMAMAGQVDATITSKIGEPFPEGMLGTVAAVDGVRAASGTLERSLPLPDNFLDGDPALPDRITALTLVGVDPETIRMIQAFQIQAGRFLQSGDENAAIVTQSLAEEAGLTLGDTLTLPTPTGTTALEVVGILPPWLLPGNEEVYVTLKKAQALFTVPGKINTIDANFDTTDPDRRQQIEVAISQSLGDSFSIGFILPGSEILTNIKTAQLMMNLLGVMGLAMGGFIIFNTFRTIVAERRRDIGMLRSVGASRRTIVGLVLVEGLVLGVIGSVAGLLLGYLFGLAVLTAVAPVLQEFLNLQFQGLPVIPGLVVVSLLAGVGITLLAGLLPAITASRVTPLEALRPALGTITLRRVTGTGFWVGLVLIIGSLLALASGNNNLVMLGSVLFISGLLLIGPALVLPISSLFGRLAAVIFARSGTAKLAEGNLTRQPSRAAVTASTTMIALAIVLMAASMISSVVLTFSQIMEKSLGSDYMLVPPSLSTWGLNVGASPDLAQKLRQVEGVKVVSTTRFSAAQINGVAVGLLGIDPEAYQQVSALEFSEGVPQEAFQEVESGRAMIINGVLAGSAGLKLGDQFQVLTPTGTATYRIAGIASDYLNAKTTTGYLSQANIAQDFGRSEDVFFQINLEPGAAEQAVEAAFNDLTSPYPQFKLLKGKDFLEQNQNLLDTAFAAIYAIVVFLSIPSLLAMINTLAIGVIERRREIGMLRAVGAERKQVRTVILAEALILSAIGTSFGLLAGLYLGYMVIIAMEAFGFPIDYIFPAGGVVIAIASGLLFGALASLIPARQAAKMEIVSALRYE